MLTPERHQIILKLIKENHTVAIHTLVEATQSSESTIRRDLAYLEEENKLKRVHGGATYVRPKSEELSLHAKSTIHLDKKLAIAEYAAKLVQNGDCIYLDAGTTTLQMIPFLKDKQIVVVTNNLTILDLLMEHQITSYVTGGFMKSTTKALVGQHAINQIKQFRFDKCFIGANGIHPDYGYTTPDPDEAAMKLTALEMSQNKYIVADETKFNEVSFSKIIDLHEAMLITNNIPVENQHLTEMTNIKVVTP
ncbi:DeoR family fructose operon transcriptional repressor [Salirhabdus euzebyi]|uniref:DeoR family fructose operon transcriptional repressor n=1 Tax=Salirhabdus euzebyi TaxID=394506 RepID=A0A841Q5F5_9BACI|nr:DeoR/GlpR family DNA-binding transcription regulator [Salirhabdus euzebyi]MBB6453562.1 DeoR family fructose operon transcriptional repressor [Salirhabdus euzebyi]